MNTERAQINPTDERIQACLPVVASRGLARCALVFPTAPRAGGSKEISRWWSEPKRAQPPVRVHKSPAPRREREKQSIHSSPPSPQIPLIIFHQTSLQHRQVFLLKRLHPMMFRLIQYIRTHRVYVRRADRKGTVSLLPFKPRHLDFSVNPFRGLAFELPHHIRKAMSSSEPHKNMRVIGNASHRMSHAVESTHRSADVFMNTVDDRIVEPGFTVLCAEHDVVMKRKVGGRHGQRFSRSCRSAIRLHAATGGCARSGSLHHRLISLEPPAH